MFEARLRMVYQHSPLDPFLTGTLFQKDISVGMKVAPSVFLW